MISAAYTKEQKRPKYVGILASGTIFALLAATVGCSGLAQHGEVSNKGQNQSTSGKSSETSAGVDQQNRASADTVARQIELCPPWSELGQEDNAKRQQILTCLEKIAKYDKQENDYLRQPLQ